MELGDPSPGLPRPHEPAPALLLEGIRRTFGPVVALDGARLRIGRGEIHALLGENGAGKTTLVSVAAGSLRPEGGTIRRNGRRVSFRSPADARAAGIALVPQHDLLVEAASLADNLALLDPASRAVEGRSARVARVSRASELLGLDLGSPDALAGELSVGARQRAAIAGALLARPEVLVLDEPTAVLSPVEATALFAALRTLAAAGTSVVLITHRIPEVFEVAGRLTLLSRGRTLLEADVAAVSPSLVASDLLGDDPGAARAGGAAALRKAEGGPPPGAQELPLRLSAFRPAASTAPLVSLEVSPGETLVLLAIDGNGADRIAAAVAGLVPFEGSVTVAGLPVRSGRTADFRRAGGALVPADRTTEGLFPSMSLAENLAIGRRNSLYAQAGEILESFDVRGAGADSPASSLSGGNQQKLVLARELAVPPSLLVAVQPSRGLDIGAAAAVLDRVASVRASGAGALVVTSDPDEALALGGTIRVAYRGALSPALAPGTSPGALARLMSGLAA